MFPITSSRKQVCKPHCTAHVAKFSEACSEVMSMQAGASATAGVVAKVENPAKNSKRITDWIRSIGNLQKVTPPMFLCLHGFSLS